MSSRQVVCFFFLKNKFSLAKKNLLNSVFTDGSFIKENGVTLVTGFLMVKFSSSGDLEKCMLTAEVLFELPSQINPKHFEKEQNQYIVV